MRGGEEGLVYLYTGVTGGFAGVLQGMQKHPDLARARRGFNTSQHVVSSEPPGPLLHTLE